MVSDSISVKYRTGKSTETESRSGLSGAGEEGIGVTVYGAFNKKDKNIVFSDYNGKE